MGAIGAATSPWRNRHFHCAILYHFDYAEYSNYNQRLDRELGWLPGLALSARLSSQNGYQLSYEINYHRGAIDYNGLTNYGAALHTQTDETLLTHRIRLGRQLKKNIALFASASRHAWNRDIRTTSIAIGPYEEYRWKEYSAGIDLSLASNEKTTWLLEAAALRTSQVKQFLDYSEANLGTANLNLGENPGIRVQLAWHYNDSTQWSVNVKTRYEYWTFGESGGTRTTGGASSIPLSEPRSETSILSIQAAFEYRL